jgi:hypothetical protein
MVIIWARMTSLTIDAAGMEDLEVAVKANTGNFHICLTSLTTGIIPTAIIHSLTHLSSTLISLPHSVTALHHLIMVLPMVLPMALLTVLLTVLLMVLLMALLMAPLTEALERSLMMDHLRLPTMTILKTVPAAMVMICHHPRHSRKVAMKSKTSTHSMPKTMRAMDLIEAMDHPTDTVKGLPMDTAKDLPMNMVRDPHTDTAKDPRMDMVKGLRMVTKAVGTRAHHHQ